MLLSAPVVAAFAIGDPSITVLTRDNATGYPVMHIYWKREERTVWVRFYDPPVLSLCNEGDPVDSESEVSWELTKENLELSAQIVRSFF